MLDEAGNTSTGLVNVSVQPPAGLPPQILRPVDREVIDFGFPSIPEDGVFVSTIIQAFDPDGDRRDLVYTVSGGAHIFGPPTGESVGFTAPGEGIYTFTLTTTAHTGLTDTHTFSMNVHIVP